MLTKIIFLVFAIINFTGFACYSVLFFKSLQIPDNYVRAMAVLMCLQYAFAGWFEIINAFVEPADMT